MILYIYIYIYIYRISYIYREITNKLLHRFNKELKILII